MHDRLTSRIRLYFGLVLLLTLFQSGSVQAQSTEDPVRFVLWLKNDVQAVPKALLHTPGVRLIGSATAIVVLARWDKQISKNALKWRKKELMRVLEEMGDANSVRPLAIVLFTGSLFSRSHRFQDAAFTSLESLIMANVLTNALKFSFGRQRPFQTDQPDVFKPLGGGFSFPSGHATTAFAFVTPWVLYYPGIASGTLAVLAAGTAFSRVPLKYHWPSDVLAGALVGATTSAWLVRRHTRRGSENPTASRFKPVIGPTGFSLTVSF